MTFWAGVLLMFGAYMVTAEEFLLDMANKAVDDMYDGCADQMLELVKNGLLDNEKNTNENFRDAWNDAQMYYNGIDTEPKTLGRDELVAVYSNTKTCSQKDRRKMSDCLQEN
ncbi:hypothetical protein OJAV_G00001200 [Oryzias javanicus]|uniref:NAD(P)(+)--arginine ADP-ribosyltransferase n=1 Tax=Oryzias javanicus TaxID=123683 RepID=A0A3S2QAH0_ORYJA|nr:hypothetical protein OJAV_G00001200 [Oryzias javanicus]